MKTILFSALILLTATGCAVRLPENDLKEARGKLEHYLLNDAVTQSEMNILSQNMVELANMERHLLEYRICNQSDYEKIEKDFLADCEVWGKRAESEIRKPSRYEGGSMAPLDHNLRMTDFIEKRIAELRQRWMK